MPDTATNADLADRYRCSVRTIQRMRADGIDVTDPVAVAERLATTSDPSIDMLERVISELETDDE